MTKKEADILADSIVHDIYHCTNGDTPKGSGYHNLKTMEIKGKDGDVQINVVCEVCKYKDEEKGTFYYGIFNYAEVDGGDAICSPDWMYTYDCRKANLSKALRELANDIYTDETVQAYYNEAA